MKTGLKPHRVRRDCYHLGFSMGERRRFDFFEHPLEGDESPPIVIASEGESELAWISSFWDPWNDPADIELLEDEFQEVLSKA